ncbi:uncharacterized protein CTHT_0072580 [Thermochaetoides thermophila DSM 1495]|uniref:Uncharacterized protein n=1 Tax=Chaetomium thermophilum (strain DSM 1495 / CBS 144.50 / IMI 039719) TaxID=759272 RepID=G0SFY4_CHATD|nr:hypothetical protein CTHT_0072580 [Thermochaetoides thermophila DSM 1495]EGS17899.1 hypothetical protein CTHT_0072580 [Thermochaetoides thermophila DSM 1495]
MVYCKLYKEARLNFYRERVASASTPVEPSARKGPREPSSGLARHSSSFDWAAKLADPPSDAEIKNAILGAASNTPGLDGVPLAFFRHTWELMRPAARAIAGDVAGAVPSRSALNLVQALVYDAETMSRQGYHGSWSPWMWTRHTPRSNRRSSAKS